MARRKSNDPVATCVKERIGADDEGENLLTPDKIERCVDFAGAAGRQRAKLHAKRPRRCLGVRQLVRRSRPKSRIPKKANGCCLRHKFVQQSHPLGLQQIGQDVDAGDVSARSVKTLDEIGLDRVAADDEHDRDRGGRGFGRKRRRFAATRHEYVHLSPDQIRRQFRKPIVLAFRIPILNCHILILDVPGFDQRLAECRYIGSALTRRSGLEKPNQPHRPLLCARCERPRGCRAGERG